MKIFYLSLTAVVVLTAHSAMAQAQQSNSNNINVSNGHIYIGEGAKAEGRYKDDTKSVAVGKNAKVAESSVAVGFDANAAHEGATAVGKTAKAQSYAVAMGYQANAGVQAVSIGKDSKATEKFAVAVGDEAKATAKFASALGQGATASGNYSNAFGYKSKSINELSTAIGWDSHAAGLRSQAIGPQAKVYGDRSLSIGNDVQTHKERSFSIGSSIVNKGTKTTVIGNNINVEVDNSVFLGDSSAYVEKGETTGGIGKVNGNYAGVDAKGVVSVGSKGNERRIQNVAAGLLSHRSTDAVNGSQLHATNQRVEEVNKDAKAGIAAAMAFKDVPFVPGKWSYAAGAARYSSESAVSLNLGRTSANGKYAISGGISSDSRGRVGFRVGVSGVFN
ncbi:Haemagluttinin domain protein [Histophilus somni 2336]|uniref:YadA-like family protein n=2 Tax=Histophilus somni TaxID=731 RepID=UPI0000397204|nr:YadA-like family protein [Histophilus somni]ACA30937.1 Haemagluttinin domain protein [Histophilus somni 2336]